MVRPPFLSVNTGSMGQSSTEYSHRKFVLFIKRNEPRTGHKIDEVNI